MMDIWRTKFLNVKNEWNGEVDCPVVMGPCCLISEEDNNLEKQMVLLVVLVQGE